MRRAIQHPSREEAMAVASGVVAYTGTYKLDESTKTAHLTHIDTNSVSNFVGPPNQRRIVTYELKLTNPRTPARVTLELVTNAGEVTSLPLSSASGQ